jgi:hypothetical protein
MDFSGTVLPKEPSMVNSRHPFKKGSTASLETVMLPGGKGEKWFHPVFQ